ncbi:MAG: zinc ABC transporter substrate-binding protein [Erysipelotrichales bacterium]|nr:zinc ABC transporter substrate-binding protein [Erysipelotrichales bacterium]
MKRLYKILICVSALSVFLTGCGKNAGSEDSSSKLKISVTVFPEYDWIKEIMGDRFKEADVILLLDNGTDLHNYQPTAQDIVDIHSSDLFVYVGGESDKWVEDVLRTVKNDGPETVNLMEVLKDRILEEEETEGMQEEEHSHEEEETGYDEHVWLSLRNTELLVSALADQLSVLDPEGESVYRANAEAYKKKLEELDAQYQAAVSSGNKDTLLFADRFPFRYMTEDYGLNYYAAFAGCSAESEASFETVLFLAKKTDELELRSICTIESSDGSIARTVRDTTAGKDQKILVFDSLQSCGKKDAENGVTYYDVMRKNLEVLIEALD